MKRLLTLSLVFACLCPQETCHAVEGFTLFRPRGNQGRGSKSHGFLRQQNAEEKSHVVNTRFRNGKQLTATKQRKVALSKAGQQKGYKSITKLPPRKAALESEGRPKIRPQIKKARPDYLTR